MILAVFKIRNSRYIGFEISGHANFAQYGKDIVCASVSSAVQLCINTITDFFKIKADVLLDENMICLSLNESKNDIISGCLLIESLKCHLELISEDYKQSINIRITEV